MPAEIEKLWEQGAAWLKAAGAELVEVSLPHTKYALPAYYIVAPAEGEPTPPSEPSSEKP
jgi:aspartyl-tRNA(Asn)/glutamyl-tRNA(Gln) amidotransferase subunit A